MKYSTFNKTNLNVLRKELEDVLKKHGVQDGLNFSIGKISFMDASCKIEVTAKIEGAQTFEDVMLETRIQSLKLKRVNSQGYRLVEYMPRNYKMPFVYETPNGKRFKCGDEQVIRLFAA